MDFVVTHFLYIKTGGRSREEDNARSIPVFIKQRYGVRHCLNRTPGRCVSRKLRLAMQSLMKNMLSVCYCNCKTVHGKVFAKSGLSVQR